MSAPSSAQEPSLAEAHAARLALVADIGLAVHAASSRGQVDRRSSINGQTYWRLGQKSTLFVADLRNRNVEVEHTAYDARRFVPRLHGHDVS
jgi:hypothetical protein